MTRTLVAGVGNVFFGDDGFGCEVARALQSRPRSDGVSIIDFGIRGMHLAYELSGGAYDRAIIVDAVKREGRPGTLYVIEPELDGETVPDAHGIDLGSVFAMTCKLGTPPARLWVVGCEAGELVERLGLSDELAGAVDAAAALVTSLLEGDTP